LKLLSNGYSAPAISRDIDGQNSCFPKIFVEKHLRDIYFMENIEHLEIDSDVGQRDNHSSFNRKFLLPSEHILSLAS